MDGCGVAARVRCRQSMAAGAGIRAVIMRDTNERVYKHPCCTAYADACWLRCFVDLSKSARCAIRRNASVAVMGTDAHSCSFGYLAPVTPATRPSMHELLLLSFPVAARGVDVCESLAGSLFYPSYAECSCKHVCQILSRRQETCI